MLSTTATNEYTVLYFYPSPRPIPFPKNSIQAAQWREWIQIQNHAWKFPPPHILHTPQRKIDGKATERTTQCPMNETHPAPHRRTIRKITTENPISTTADTLHPTEKDRRKNDREDDTMPYERDTPCPAPEFNLKNQHRKSHTLCTMDGNDQNPKPHTRIPTAADTIHPTER